MTNPPQSGIYAASAESAKKGLDDSGRVRTCVRVRPINDREKGESAKQAVFTYPDVNCVRLRAVDNTTMFSLHGQPSRSFTYDGCYGEEETAGQIYSECIAPLVQRCFEGFRATVLAYGQTVESHTGRRAWGTGGEPHGAQGLGGSWGGLLESADAGAS
ncbi:hypothetical protein CYMTET_17663 [Cymbomonas tetramitiformis]|uniref:Kinesin motor domain-containing protein n=1 Tax=Cymbomonas tetramitiformis TaxID=36881 RepID=A0AAE0L6X2_9CHLO|nr:hypothetical protein CYMTET_17663 [Cymbomonas tetramitiformis]